MSEPNQLIYPTVDLFLYDLRESLGQTQEIDLNRQRFWEKIYDSKFSQEKLKDRKQAEAKESEKQGTDYAELLGSREVKEFESPLDGYYYPVRLGDTYALQVDCSGEKILAENPGGDLKYQSNFSPRTTEIVSSIRQAIVDQINHTQGEQKIAKDKQGTIGQTWLFLGQLAAEEQDPEKAAISCYDQLKLVHKPDWERNVSWEKGQKRKGKLFEATIFELWRPPLQWQQLNQNHHLLICLFPHNKSVNSIRKEIGELYPHLLRLFCFRNKILWAYSESRKLEAQLKTEFGKIQNIVEYLHKQIDSRQLEQLRKTLSETLATLSTYVTCLNDLYYQSHTIETNLENYKKRLKTIAKLDGSSDLEFLRKFSVFARDKYLQQVKTDHANLSPGVTLLENAIKTIEGIVQIEQTSSERRFNNTVAIAGVGLATSQVASAVILAQNNPSKEIPFFLTSAFGWSLATGIIAGLLTSLIIWKAIPRILRP